MPSVLQHHGMLVHGACCFDVEVHMLSHRTKHGRHLSYKGNKTP